MPLPKPLLAIPAMIDPHVHFRVPGHEYKEDWKSASIAAFAGGITHVFDMPNNTPSITTVDLLLEKKKIIDQQLQATGLPLRYGLYLGATSEHLDEISKAHGIAIGVKIFMGGSTGDLLLDDKKALDEAFRRASDASLVVAVHAEDQKRLQMRKEEHSGLDPSIHSVIRDPEAARIAVREAIELADKHRTKLYILHVSTQAEIDEIRAAKKRGVTVFAEATPHHLYLSTDDYKTLGSRALMNPPLRAPQDKEALWEALIDGTIDTIGTDHAPHTIEEKNLPYGKAPCGIPGIDLVLPLLLDAFAREKITLERLIALTSTNISRLFSLPPQKDVVIVDMNEKQVEQSDIRSKCSWSPYLGWKLKGWPIFTIANGKVFSCRKTGKKEQEFVDQYLKESRSLEQPT